MVITTLSSLCRFKGRVRNLLQRTIDTEMTSTLSYLKTPNQLKNPRNEFARPRPTSIVCNLEKEPPKEHIEVGKELERTYNLVSQSWEPWEKTKLMMKTLKSKNSNLRWLQQSQVPKPLTQSHSKRQKNNLTGQCGKRPSERNSNPSRMPRPGLS